MKRIALIALAVMLPSSSWAQVRAGAAAQSGLGVSAVPVPALSAPTLSISPAALPAASLAPSLASPAPLVAPAMAIAAAPAESVAKFKYGVVGANPSQLGQAPDAELRASFLKIPRLPAVPLYEELSGFDLGTNRPPYEWKPEQFGPIARSLGVSSAEEFNRLTQGLSQKQKEDLISNAAQEARSWVESVASSALDKVRDPSGLSIDGLKAVTADLSYLAKTYKPFLKETTLQKIFMAYGDVNARELNYRAERIRKALEGGGQDDPAHTRIFDAKQGILNYRFLNHDAARKGIIGINDRSPEELGIPKDDRPIFELSRQVIGEALNDRVFLRQLATARVSTGRDRGVDFADPKIEADALVRRFEQKRGVLLAPGVRRALLANLTAQPTEQRSRPQHFSPGTRLRYTAMETLEAGAVEIEKERYLLEIKEAALTLYKGLLPEFYREHPFQLKTNPQGATGEYSTHDDGTHEISILLPTPSYLQGAFEPKYYFGGGEISFELKVLITFIHEYSHLLFQEAMTAHGKSPTLSKKRSAFDALTEGFAVMMELLVMNKIIAAQDELGLGAQDAADLKKYKRHTINMVKRGRELAHYREGLFYFWHKIYKEGEKKKKGQGVAEMLKFLRSLDGEKLNAIDLKGKEFQRIRGRPDLFRPAFASSMADQD